MAERLHAEPLYHPRKGMNLDSNGVSARIDEAIDIVNCDITTAEVLPRSGTTVLGDFDWDITSTSTVGALNALTIVFDESTENGRLVWSEASPYRIAWYVDPDGIVDSQWYISPDTFDNAVFVNLGTELYPPKTGWTPVDLGVDTFSLAYTSNETELPVIAYHHYLHPIQGGMTFALCATDIFKFVENTGWVSVTSEVFDVQQWSTTDFVDIRLGATVVCAGSVYTAPSQAYTDVTSRVLLYYDLLTDTFVTYTMYEPTLDEQDLTSVSGSISGLGGTSVITVGTNGTAWPATTPLGEIVNNTAYLVVSGSTINGVIGVAGTIKYTDDAGRIYNRFLPVDDTQVLYGDDSIIYHDNGEYKISVPDNTLNGHKLYIFYSYVNAVDYLPLYVSNFHGALLMANTVEKLTVGGSPEWHYFPWRIRWTLPGYGNIAREEDYEELVLDDISPILRMKALETEASSSIFGPIYIYKNNSIVRATYNQNYGLNPDLPVPMLSFEIAHSEGVEATRTIVSIDSKHVYLGKNDVYAFDGVNRVSLTEDPENKNTRVQKAIFDNIDLSNLQNSFAVYDEINRQYMLFVKLLNNAEYPTDCFLYDLDLGSWRRYTYPETSAALTLDITVGRTIDDLKRTIAGLTDQTANESGRIEDLLVDGSLSKKVIFSQGYETYYIAPGGTIDRAGTYEDDYSKYFITRDFFGETLEEQDRTQRVYLEAKNDSVIIGINLDYSIYPYDFEALQTLNFGSNYSRETYSPDDTAIHARFMIELIDYAEFRWMQVFSNRQEYTNE